MQIVYDNKKYGFDIGICLNQFMIALPFAVDWFSYSGSRCLKRSFSFSIFFLCFGLHFEFRRWRKQKQK